MFRKQVGAQNTQRTGDYESRKIDCVIRGGGSDNRER